MKIKEITISNWRSIKSLQISFQDLMIFIGQNNHGKSNVLSAILFFFGEQKHHELDFNYGSEELFVEIKFYELDENDKITFKKYLTTENLIKVRKTAYLSGNFEYKGYTQIPSEEWLQEQNASNYTSRERADESDLSQYLPRIGRLTKALIIEAQQKYIQNHSDDVVFNYELEETNFLGLKNVAKSIFGNVYFIPAIKDATDDFSSKETSAFGKLYSKIIEGLSNNNPDWNHTKNNLSLLFRALNKHDIDGNHNENRPPELTNFEHKLNAQLESWKAEIDVEIVTPNVDDIFKANTQIWINDGVRTDIKRKGHGLQRALTFALIKVIADELKEEREQSITEIPESRSVSSLTYFILEEPELYLHPQAQRSLFDSLVELSKSGNQVMLCTHSSALVDLDKYRSICIVKKDSEDDGTKVCQCLNELFIGDIKKDFNLSYWINPDRSELFFAKKVILLEGTTEKTVIPYLAKKLNVFKYDYTLIDCASKKSIPSYMRLLNKFFIPYVVVYDKDHQARKPQCDLVSADRDSDLIESEMNTSLGQSIIFINDIEEEIGISTGENKPLNKPFKALEHVSQENYQIPELLKTKLLEIFA